jgi:hypothetical protein
MFTKAREERQQPRADQASRRRGRLPQRRLFPSAVEACPHRPLNAGRSRQPQHATTRLSPRAVERWVKAASASRHSRASPSSTRKGRAQRTLSITTRLHSASTHAASGLHSCAGRGSHRLRFAFRGSRPRPELTTSTTSMRNHSRTHSTRNRFRSKKMTAGPIHCAGHVQSEGHTARTTSRFRIVEYASRWRPRTGRGKAAICQTFCVHSFLLNN